MSLFFKPKKIYVKKYAVQKKRYTGKGVKYINKKPSVVRSKSFGAPVKRKPVSYKQKKTVSFNFGAVLKYAGYGVLLCLVAMCFVFALKLGMQFIDRINQNMEAKEAIEEIVDDGNYIYPAPSDEARALADKYREDNKTKEYIPSDGEVPGLYVSDYIKTCYLTFDDGPSPVTEKVLDVLTEYNIKATFFVVGNQVRAYPQIIKRMYDEGHSIGNHTYTHVYDSVYRSDADFNDELLTVKRAVDSVLGINYDNLLFRFPGGSWEGYKKAFVPNVKMLGYEYVDWNALNGDSEGAEPTAEALMKQIEESTDEGSTEDIVVLMHDAGAKDVTAESLPQVIEYLIKKGYEFRAIYNSSIQP